ncbi:MAG: T9SS type A sorting domain-containing protein [Ginsengibacter sp.]
MKKLYLTIFGVLLFFITLQKSHAQCTCSDGSTPDSIQYSNYYDSIIATNTVITFPQFDPAIGILTCIKLSDTVTTVVSYNLQNDLAYTEDYIFETYRRSQFTGPGGFFSSISSPPKNYGPYTLQPKDSIGDNVDIGPDTVFNKRYHQQYASSNPAFYGTGTVNFNYLTTSTFTILTGSDNAIFKLRAYTRLFVNLTYYWCPSIVLTTQVSDFKVSLKNDNKILIEWSVNAPANMSKDEIEVSRDGKIFKNQGQGYALNSGTILKYNYLYSTDENFTGNLFFRIKKTDLSGKIIYSDIKSVAINKKVNGIYSLYPNPSVSGVSIQFAKNAGGNYEVKLLNTTGQKIFEKKYSLNSKASINIEWPQKPMPGIYYLKVKDLQTSLEETARLQVM